MTQPKEKMSVKGSTSVQSKMIHGKIEVENVQYTLLLVWGSDPIVLVGHVFFVIIPTKEKGGHGVDNGNILHMNAVSWGAVEGLLPLLSDKIVGNSQVCWLDNVVEVVERHVRQHSLLHLDGECRGALHAKKREHEAPDAGGGGANRHRGGLAQQSPVPWHL